MRPAGLKTRIFLDGGDPKETKETVGLLGFLDGQTTNPSLLSKTPEAQVRLAAGRKFSEIEVFDLYRRIVIDISGLIPQGSVSVEVNAGLTATTDEMLRQAREMYRWIPNAHIKFPTTDRGLAAAEVAVSEGMRVNMTLCFSQEQAAAVYAATRGAKKGDVFISPFVGRLDDRGENGMDLIKNIFEMYKSGDGHVEVLTASVRNLDHFLYAIQLGSDILTAPFRVLKEWGEKGFPLPASDFSYKPADLKPIPYKSVSLGGSWGEYAIEHEMTKVGIERFSADWSTLVG
ncbi:transaldolase [Candidatus Parcubacteria bacterium]|nr:MAG: transaldolase [Candidatus Parcubacteria bacterium]